MAPFQVPLPIYPDLDGSPLDSGYLYFGEKDLNPETDPIAVYWDDAGTQPAAQPIRTLNGFAARNGTASRVYIDGPFSLTIRDKKRRFLFYFKDASDGVSLLEADLSSTDSGKGGALVGYLNPAPSAIPRTVSGKLSESTSLLDFGTDGEALRTAAAGYGITGGLLRIPKDTYVVDASGGDVVNITDPVSLVGDGGVYTAINPSSASATDNTITINPTTADHSLQSIERLSLHDPSTGLRTGEDGIYLDTQDTGQQLPKFTIRDVNIGQGSGYGVHHLNIAMSNVNGGMYAALIENSSIKGGIYFDGSGDSNSVSHCLISGTNIGVRASLTPGASLLEVQACNITTAGGAIRIDAGPRPRIIGNNIENLTAGAAAQNDSAVVNLAGANGTIYGGVVAENLVSAFGTTTATTLIRLRNCRGTLVENNVILAGVITVTTGIDIGSDCFDVRVGPNTFGSTVATPVIDAGTGTMGVVKTLSLQNSWVAFAVGSQAPAVMKSADGMVHVFGSMKSGTTANGTLIFTLPDGFRPASIHRVAIMVVNAGTPQLAEASIESNGDVRLAYVLASDQVNLNFSIPAASLANATSLE